MQVGSRHGTAQHSFVTQWYRTCSRTRRPSAEGCIRVTHGCLIGHSWLRKQGMLGLEV